MRDGQELTLFLDPATGALSPALASCWAGPALPGCRRDRRLSSSVPGDGVALTGRASVLVGSAPTSYGLPPGPDVPFSVAALRLGDDGWTVVTFAEHAERARALVAELDAACRLLRMEIARAEAHGAQLPEKIELGCMLEVPALYWQMPELLKRIKFLSVVHSETPSGTQNPVREIGQIALHLGRFAETA